MRAGLSSLDRVYFKNTQADHEGVIAKPSLTMISANFISKAKNVIAQAFTPSFAVAHA
jgi:hypothetical protein